MELKVFESPGQEWDEFASRYTDLIFYQSVWSQVLKEGLGGQPLYFYLREGGEIVAGLPGVLLNFRILKILYASIPYGNLIGQKSYYPSFLELLEKEVGRRGIDQIRLTESPFSNCRPPGSFKSIPAKCTLLDLKGSDEEKKSQDEDEVVIRPAQAGFFARVGPKGRFQLCDGHFALLLRDFEVDPGKSERSQRGARRAKQRKPADTLLTVVRAVK